MSTVMFHALVIVAVLYLAYLLLQEVVAFLAANPLLLLAILAVIAVGAVLAARSYLR